MSISLLRYDEANVTPRDDAILHDFIVGATGVISGCEITHLGSNQLQIAAGRGIIQGRDFVVTQQTINATVSDSGTKHGRLIIEVDIENTTTPISFKTQMASSLPALTQEDINEDGTVYQLAMATYDISTVLISNLSVVDNSLTGVKPHTHTHEDIDDGYPNHIVGARFTRAASQTIASSTLTAIQWADRPYNPDESHDTSNITRMICREAGVYSIMAGVKWSPPFTAAAGASLNIYKNGVALIGGQSEIAVYDAGITSLSQVAVYDLIELAVGDYIEAKVFHSASQSENISNAAMTMRLNRF